MSSNLKTIQVIGAASGVAAPHSGCGDGPQVLQKSPFLSDAKSGLHLHWASMLKPQVTESTLKTVTEFNQNLAREVAKLVQEKQFFTVFGGDHSCAIGTWSGVYSEVRKQGDLGLIWIDAHMDSHTPASSQTGNIHGMPLAALLGHGAPELTSIGTASAKLKPQHVCLIGVRSYEEGEAALLKSLNVRIYFMDEVEERGLDVIMKEAIEIANSGTVAYGITLDIDSIDPNEAPATGVSEAGGLSAQALCQALSQAAHDPRLIGTEIVEFDPHLDKNQKTEKLIPMLLAAMTLGVA
ncbi:MAG: arginase [Gammaproteobacteria bacterium]|nr:arginase [Gammaproteobacteria bacterium]